MDVSCACFTATFFVLKPSRSPYLVRTLLVFDQLLVGTEVLVWSQETMTGVP